MELIPASLGLMLVLYAEALGAARTFALKNGYEVNAIRSCTHWGWQT